MRIRDSTENSDHKNESHEKNNSTRTAEMDEMLRRVNVRPIANDQRSRSIAMLETSTHRQRKGKARHIHKHR